MSLLARTEHALKRHFESACGVGAPPRLVQAMRHAVFSGGARIRPQLCMAVAVACGDDQPGLTDAAAVALELMHCASLVHDDMPAFDDADTRRGQPTVHKAFSEPLALLTGDGLIVMAYQVLLQGTGSQTQRLPLLMDNLNRGVGLPAGIVAGQAWECESAADLSQYQRAKTGALFVSATCAGAISSGSDPAPWAALGAFLGEAYQVADDIRDVMGDADSLGKPAGQDALHARPSAARALGLEGAIGHFQRLIDHAGASIPACACRDMLRQLVLREAERLVPPALCEQARRRQAAAASPAGTAPAVRLVLP
ncbi:MAG: polyprenyl synthetase family protein [Limnohabitans sp.]